MKKKKNLKKEVAKPALSPEQKNDVYSDIDSELKNILSTGKISPKLKGELRGLNDKIKKLSEKDKLYSSLVNIDGLTGLYNHRYFQDTLFGELSRAVRFKYSVSIAIIDIDYFKKFNDTYGHPQGDAILREIAQLIRSKIRSYDVVCRYGGEEFALILPHTSSQDAVVLIKRIRRDIASYPFYGTRKGKKEKVKLTISAGIAGYPANAQNKTALINRADKALYIAKEEGRNRECSSLIAEKTFIRFAFCPPMLSPFYSNVLKGVREVAEEVGNVDVIVLAGRTESSYGEQLALMQRAIKEKVDAIGLCSKIDVGKVVLKANKANIPVFIFNVNELTMKHPGKITSYICYEQEEAGEKVGRFLAKSLRTKGNVAIIEGIPGEIDSIERKEGFVKVAKQYPCIKIIASQPGDWDREKAKLVAEKILKKHPEVDAFFCLSDEMALGAVDVVREAGKIDKIFVVGLDGNQNAFQSIKDGELFATLNTNPLAMGKILMRTVLRSTIKEEVIAQKTKSPIMIVNQENIDHYF